MPTAGYRGFFCGLNRTVNDNWRAILTSHRTFGGKKLIPAILLVLIASLISLFIITSALASPAGGAPDTGSQIDALENQSADLDNSYNQALQELVAVDSEVERQDSEIQAVHDRSIEITASIAAQEQNLADLQERLAERQGTLEKRITSSYKSDDMGYLEVVMGAGDFSDFLSRVDMVNKIAGEDQKLIDDYKETQREVEAELGSLAAKRDELKALEDSLTASAQELLDAQMKQQSYVASLESQMSANQGQLDQLRAEAAQIESNMSSMQSQADQSGEGGGGTPPPAGGTSFSVTATAYCLTGRTATGMPAGPGVIAVDPSVIPLGSRVYVSGYGNAIAADTGGAIHGNKIDVWLPCNDTYSWGVRTVTVTIY